jgi:CysZ protein
VIDATIKALEQMFSAPFRAMLLKSAGLALLLIVLLGVALDRLLVALADLAQHRAAGALGPWSELPLGFLAKALSIAAALGIVAGSVLLMPAVTALVASFFADAIALEVERRHYPADPAGAPLPPLLALVEGVETALLAAIVYLVALPFLLFAGFGTLIFFFATAFLLGRQYFDLAAMRFHPPAQARRLRRAHRGRIFAAGMIVAVFVSIPILNLATPLFGMALMVHVYKRLAAGLPSPARE